MYASSYFMFVLIIRAPQNTDLELDGCDQNSASGDIEEDYGDLEDDRDYSDDEVDVRGQNSAGDIEEDYGDLDSDDEVEDEEDIDEEIDLYVPLHNV